MAEKARKAAPPKKAKQQAKTMPAGKIKAAIEDEAPAPSSPTPFQVPLQQQAVALDPSLFQNNNNKIGFEYTQNEAEEEEEEEEVETGQVEEQRAKLEKIPPWARQESKKATEFVQEQVQQINKFIPLKKALPRKAISPVYITVNVAEQALSKPDGFDSPAKYLNFFTTSGSHEVITGISMKEMRQVDDVLFYWPRFASRPFKAVSTLDISFCTNVTDLGLRWIAYYLPSLTDINVTGCRLITEAALKLLISTRNEQLTKAKFDMTSVRYVPPHSQVTHISTKGCPLILDEAAILKAKPNLPSELPAKFSRCKIVVLKPFQMRDKFIAHEFAKPDDEVGVGAATFVCSYRSGQFLIVECCDDMSVQMLLSDNCFVVLPFPGGDETKTSSPEAIEKVARSVESRFNLVVSMAKNVSVVAVPIFNTAGNSGDNTEDEPKAIVDAVKAEISSMVKKAENDEKTGEAEYPKFPPNKHMATLRYLMDHDLHVAHSLSGVMPWIRKRIPHSDIPISISLMLQGLDKANLLNQKETSFFTVEHFAQSLTKHVSADFHPCWPSFVSLLAETGNYWLEPVSTFCNDGPTLVGPKHAVTSFFGLVKLLTNLHDTADSSAVAEDIQCLALDTPLCTIEHVKQLICPTPGSQFSDDDISRVMNLLETSGIAIFRRKSALAMSVLRPEPPISVDHFLVSDSPSSTNQHTPVMKTKAVRKASVTESKPSSVSSSITSIKLDYPVLCRPRSLFPTLVAMLAKILPPTLLWRSGAFFYEASFLDVLLTYDDVARTFSVRFSAESFAFENLASVLNEDGSSTTRGVARLKSALRGSCSIIHTVCCLILSPFSNADLSLLGTLHEIRMLPIERINHEVKLLSGRSLETFSRQFDLSLARCSKCFYDVKTISSLRYLFYLKERNKLIGTKVLHRSQQSAETLKPTLVASLCDWVPLGDLGCSGFRSTFVDVMTVDGIHFIEIFPCNGNNGVSDSGQMIKLTFDDADKLVNCSLVDNNNKADSTKTAVSKQAQTSANKKTSVVPAKPSSATPSKVVPHLISKGLRIEAHQNATGHAVISISTNGGTIFETTFSSACSKFAVTFEPKQSVKLAEFPLYCNAPGDSLISAVVGMYLEAFDRFPTSKALICVAHIKEIGSDGQWLITFDGWHEKYDYWAPPTSTDLYPCGFIEYIAKFGLLDRFQKLRNDNNFSDALAAPHGTSYSTSPFPWDTYFHDIKANEIPEEVKIGNTVGIPVPLHYFEKTHLLGFDNQVSLQYDASDFFKAEDLKESLTHYCINARPSVLLNNTSNYASDSDEAIFRIPLFIPLPSITWHLCCWPSREKLTNALATRPNFLCCWPDFIHFVNESTESMNVPPTSIHTIPPLCLAIILMKIFNQPRFIPEEFENIFSQLASTECPYSYPSLSMKTSGAVSKAAFVEHCFRQFLIPFLLDYLTIHSCYAEQSPNGYEKGDKFPLSINDPSLIEAANHAVEMYFKRLHADGSSLSRWSAVTVTPEKQKQPKCRLLNMSEAESEFFSRDTFCPRLMCGQHAYHYTTYTKAVEVDQKLDWTSSLHSFGHFHDTFLTTCAFNGEDIRDLKQPINITHPFTSEFVGFLSSPASFEKSGIFLLKHLSELVLFKNGLTDLPAEIAQLAPTLEELDLSFNLLTEIPKVVYELKSLESLRIDFVPLTSLDEKICQLSKLKRLSLRFNCLKALPANFKQLVKLETLDLTGLPSLPATSNTVYLEEIVSFFEKYNFPKNSVNVLKDWAENVEGENTLDRGGVERLNAHLFSALPRLQVANDAFPIDFSLFIDLKELHLANQPIVNVPDSIEKLVKLVRLDLSGCLLLESISAKISACPLEALSLNNCPVLKTPPAEIRKRGFVATLAYFRRLAQGSVTCKRTKLMFVGLGGAGKTSLVHALLGDLDPAQTKLDVTDGIKIKNWTVDCKDGSAVDFRMWDFAGQVVYYNTHQFFISSRAVYLLLWNIRLGHEHAGLEFWLSSIACHAPNAPILIVGTHADEVSQERSFLPEVGYRERFGSICGFHYISTWTGQGVQGLRDDIIKVALAQKHMGEAIPAAWLTFEEKLLGDRDAVPEKQQSAVPNSIMMLDRVEKLADSSGIYDPDEIDQALQFLSDLGTVQYFRTDFLRDRVIIDPQWIVDVMANVVSVKKTTIVDGRLKHSEIGHIWESYPPELHQWLLKLTEAFDLTFPLKKEAVSIVPCLLPENPPENLNWPSLEENPGHRQTKLIFSFKYLPTGLFNRVQVRLCQFSDGATIWRRGSLLRKNQHYALLTQPDSTSIHVKVQGPCPDNIAFLILEVVDTLIVEAFQGVQPDYLFSCPGCVNARASDSSMFERSRIRRASELRIPFLQCWNYFHSISTQELRQLFPAESSADFDSQFLRTVQEISNIRQTLKIDVLVIGCSADANPDDLKTAVSTPEVGKDIEKLLPKLKVVVIADPDASTDAVSFDQLSVMMRTARLIVFCLSDKFMQSERCQGAFFTGRETLKKQVLMILIRDFDWNKFPGLAFQMNDDVFVKAINRGRYKPADIVAKIQQRINQAQPGNEIQKKHPEIFISYCWQNSQDAVSRGTKTNPKALGVTDPRALKKFLTDKGFDCWIDIEQVGLGGLFRDIADGIRYAKCVIVCVSDEYSRSENCLREFHFASTSCKIPIILCPVGTGGEWQTSEVNLIVCQKSTFINFQVDLKENYDALLAAVGIYVIKPVENQSNNNNPAVDLSKTQPVSKRVPLGNIGRLQTMSNIQAAGEQASVDDFQQPTSALQSSLVLHEMVELGQRKFLRQLVSYIETTGARPYPRLIIVDVAPSTDAPQVVIEPPSDTVENTNNSENPENPENREPGSEDSIVKLPWRVRFLCEHEGSWHPSDVSLALPADRSSQVIRQSADYFGQIFSFIRHMASTSTMEIFNPKNDKLTDLCRAALSQIEKMANPDQMFDDDYCRFREVVLDLDQYASNGGLRKCQLALGKELWLCEKHQNSAKGKTAPDAPLKGAEQENGTKTEAQAGDEADNNGGAGALSRQRGHRAAARNQSDAGLAADSGQNQEGAGKQQTAIREVSSLNNLTTPQINFNSATSRACSIQ